MTVTYDIPPETQNPEGNMRRVGVEIEMGNITPDKVAAAIAGEFGGTIKETNPQLWQVETEEFGAFEIELDARFFQKMAAESRENQHQVIARSLHMLVEMAEHVVPYELVTPPLPYNTLPRLDNVIESLRRQGAEGSKASWRYAFGLHLNIEVARLDITYLQPVLRAFVILYPWLKQRMDLDITRRITSFIDPFPINYVKHLLAQKHIPTQEQFIADYMKGNPTRNRALDMLPILAELQPDVTKKLSEYEAGLVKARPAFHYRLPNCDIDKPGWTLAYDWNLWGQVEKLAVDKVRLEPMAKAYAEYLDNPLHFIDNSSWEIQVEEWLYEGQGAHLSP